MNAVRRTAVLLGLTAAVVVGSSITASASFSDTATAAATTVGTVTVAPPTAVNFEGTWCERGSYQTYNATTATYTTTYYATLHAKLAWQPSSAPGVTGYRVTATANGQFMPLGDMPFTSVTADYPLYSGSAPAPVNLLTVQASVTTLTSYNWTSLPQKSAVFSC
jgi:hypothetical protein